MINLALMLFNLMVAKKNINTMYCDIKGNVKKPGVYEVKKGEVINDIIIKAGGLKKNSYVKNINLSKLVTDEMVINIITIDEYKKLSEPCPVCVCENIECTTDTNPTITNEETTTKDIKITTNYTTTLTTTLETTTLKTTTTLKETTLNKVININTATLEELTSLVGIGEKTALNIIEYRLEHQFETIEDIKNVKGIKESVFEKIKEYITV